MTSRSAFLLWSAGMLFLGCTTTKRDLVLEPVGPAPGVSATATSLGSLVVYSAFDVHPSFNSTDPGRRRYSEYQLQREDGAPLRTVVNDLGTLLETPEEVPLTPGRYRILARANGFGHVVVPVTIAARKTTTVHLEGGGSTRKPTGGAADAVVRLPDGQAVGWRAVVP